MTDSHRREGDPQQNQPFPPAQPAQQQDPWGEQWQRSRDRLAHDTLAGSGDGGYPPPPAYPPAPGWFEAHRPQVIQGETVPATVTADGGHGGHGGQVGQGGRHGGRPARARRPVALLAAVAITAAVIGGATAAGVERWFGGTDGSGGPGFAGSNVSQSSNGTVSGVAEQVSPSVVRIDVKKSGGQSVGSGIVITADGEVVTNNHVVDGADEVQVTMSNGKKYTAKVVGTDPGKDLALIKLNGASGLKPAKLGNSDGVKVGDQVVAIGSPDGLTGTVTSGIVSALDRKVTVPKSENRQRSGQQDDPYGGGWPFSFGGRQFNGDTGSDTTSYQAIQTDAPVNPGNSGGALINMNGEIVGMPSAIYSPSNGSGPAGSVGLGFAIPVNTVKADLDHLRSGGDGGTGSGSDSDSDSGSGSVFGTGY
ncbi:trypsin-like peptidase domain-containing protein [Streptomyces bambusae]|uniref:S1C family serine protease n=1 Tax=Streptomyces bambusae TaxID=1550616 RepID=UPI001CFE5CC0|nr:trypsin-like peptidase domain-containing protein [Streptomyces bambusae]MCB5166210.1 trypsin-like peptidase domain-containing protein [Streptomyces bambusae]